jgi:hypothetical protein
MAIRTAVNRALTAITALPTAAALTDGNLTLLTTVTASSSSTVTFDSSINSTYNSYQIHIIQAHCSADNQILQMGFRDGSTAYDATKTTTYFASQHKEDASGGALGYNTDQDQAQATGFLNISEALGADNDQCTNGIIQLFDPSNTTFVKHFIARMPYVHQNDRMMEAYIAGYCNVTAAIDGVQFKMDSGNIDSGTFKLYGVGPKQS